jgi:hypothetical protein
MTRWDLMSMVAYVIGAGSYTPGMLRHRATIEGVKGTPYAEVLLALADKVEAGDMSPYQAMQFLHKQQKAWGAR